MKILAPVGIGGFQSAVTQIEAGADEIYLGGITDIFENHTYTGRTKYDVAGRRVCLENEEIKEIVDYAHSRGVLVVYAANFPFIAMDPSGGEKYISSYLEYVEKGLSLGVDSIIVGDIGALLLMKKQNYKVHITASTYFETMNIQQLYLLRELGVNRAVVSFQASFEEIKELCSEKVMEIEVFGQGCSFYDANCYLHYNKTCSESFSLYDEDKLVATGNLLDANQSCSLCSLLRLKQAGVYAVKLVGRECTVESNVETTKLYAEFLKRLESVDSNDINVHTKISGIKEELVPVWWKRVYCRSKNCRYTGNKVVQSYI